MLVSEAIPSKSLPPALGEAFSGPHRNGFLQAYNRLQGAGYGAGILRAFASAAPRVSAHVGPEEAIALAQDASLIAIKARPRVAAAFLNLSPSIALKLRDPGSFAQWRAMIATVLKRNPKAVLALLDRSDMLLDRLGLEPLGAWVQTGLRVAGQDPEQALAYFQLETSEAQRTLERYAGEVNFPTLEAGLKSFYIALWRDLPILREAEAQSPKGTAARTSFSQDIIQMPSAFRGFDGQEQQLYRAALAHVGAHKTYGGSPFKLGQLKPLQVALVSLIEDARVEALALREMPGLIRLWLPFHTAQFDGLATAPNLFAGLARALIDPEFRPDHGWIRKGLEMFQGGCNQMQNPALSRHIGNILGNDLGQTRVQFNAKSYVVQPAYRDDNQGLWDLPVDPNTPPPSQEMEADLNDFRQSEPDDASHERKQERPHREFPSQLEPAKVVEADPETGRKIFSLPEYDHNDAVERADWVSVNAYEPTLGDALFWEKLEARHGTTLSRLQNLIMASETGKRRRLKQQADGEVLDIDAAIDATIALRSHRQPDTRVYERLAPPSRSIAVHLLLDKSQSTADKVGENLTILDMERDAAAILAATMSQLGDDLAITAFCSSGRHDMRVIPVKTFDDPLDDVTGMALSGLRSGHSTRIGAALRFAARSMDDLSRYRKIVLLVTDGEPSDIDVTEPDFLVEDARHAVRQMRAKGIDAICVALGSEADQRQTEIFGRKSCVQISDVATLPSKLPAFYLRVTR